ncbi:intradiol ring-cleavage dioxygenase [Sphingobium subterraneum]|uniref:Catechol 1,2-dioxygenase n=1 Tax=Sphingobium subterraneum TaxID=627688 RepID=A0A841J368_9SPHN|nr:intradiol ring-cleavage dioxygenase [Sphingobium subterraneum]MBB6123055.1 catechol 1,2-dioxygenase [Sphingobium subterraneum]
MQDSLSPYAGSDDGLFDVEHSADVVNARIDDRVSPRLAEVMRIVTRHAHAAVKEAALTSDEWMTAIQFLTETGHMSTAWRQEFILLSDVLGISMLVDGLNHQRPIGASENTVLGPFHIADAPRLQHGDTISLDAKGEPTLVLGKVTDTAGRPVVGASLDVWQANDDGFYDVQQPDVQPKWNLRGIFETDNDGQYWFKSVKPRYYPIPDDGPVGKMLAKLGRHPNRPAHLHFIVDAPGYETVVTHIFTPDCPYLREDAVFGVKRSLIADFQHIEDAAEQERYGFTGPFWKVECDFVLVASGNPSEC